MKIGLLVEGDSEYYALPHMLKRVRGPHTILQKPLRFQADPWSSPAQIALAAAKRVPMLTSQGVGLVVLLIDKENRPDCTIELVREIEREARSRLQEQVELQVVLKVTKLENWLVADPQALRDLPGLFENVERIEKKVARDRADAVDAEALLKACSCKRSYKKPDDAIAICKKLDPSRARENSRSFRKLLKTLGCPEPQAETARGRSRRR